jgi:hypothetical protein
MPKPALKPRSPKSWPAGVPMLHVIALAKYAAVYTRSWGTDSPSVRVRLRGERDRCQEEAIFACRFGTGWLGGK